MFEGEWNNFDPTKFPEVPLFYPDLLHDYFDPALYSQPEASIDMQFFTRRREEDPREMNVFLYSVPDWQSTGELAFQQTCEGNEEEREVLRTPPTVAIHYHHAKQVGPLSIEERQAKIQRYLAKRQRRNFHKKVVYLCRKRVADTRLRVKGRFVAKQIATPLQGMENLATLPQNPTPTEEE